MAADLRSLTLDQLAGGFATADDDQRRAIRAECERRDRADRARRKRRADPVTAEWRDAAHAQMLAAETATNGVLLNRRGIAAGIDPWTLWSGPATRATAYASYELAEFWESSARLTVGEYRRQVSAARRDQEDQREPETPERPSARDLAGAVSSGDPGALDRLPAAWLDELLDAERAASWLGIATKTVYVDSSRGRWPAADLTLGRSRAWTRRTLVLHLAARPGRGTPGRPRVPRKPRETSQNID